MYEDGHFDIDDEEFEVVYQAEDDEIAFVKNIATDKDDDNGLQNTTMGHENCVTEPSHDLQMKDTALKDMPA